MVCPSPSPIRVSSRQLGALCSLVAITGTQEGRHRNDMTETAEVASERPGTSQRGSGSTEFGVRRVVGCGTTPATCPTVHRSAPVTRPEAQHLRLSQHQESGALGLLKSQYVELWHPPCLVGKPLPSQLPRTSCCPRLPSWRSANQQLCHQPTDSSAVGPSSASVRIPQIWATIL